MRGEGSLKSSRSRISSADLTSPAPLFVSKNFGFGRIENNEHQMPGLTDMDCMCISPFPVRNSAGVFTTLNDWSALVDCSSRSTAKFNLYQAAGLSERWRFTKLAMYPECSTLLKYKLSDDFMTCNTFSASISLRRADTVLLPSSSTPYIP